MSWNDFSLLKIEDIFCFPTMENNPAFAALLENAFSQYTTTQIDTLTPAILWSAERYQLHQSSAYNNLSAEEKSTYLNHLTQLNMALSLWIEKSGHIYGAKMILLSATQQEKSLYSLFAAEEAIHAREFSNFLTFTPDWKIHQHPMLIPLGNAIREGSRETLLFIIQVLLEGFGMSHYAGLMEDCLHLPLKKAYARILKDEARHHGAGLILTNDSTNMLKIEGESFQQVFEYTRDFLHALQSAHWLKETFTHIGRPLSKKEENQLWQEIEFDQLLLKRRQKFKEMIIKSGQKKLMDALMKENLF
jgi:hypothetical protein